MGFEQVVRAASMDRRNRILSNQDDQPERPYQSPHPEPISPFPTHSPLHSNDSPLKSQAKDDMKSEPHLSTLIDNIPTQSEETLPINPNPEADCSNMHNRSKLLSLSR
jgi:hypothetical protein